MKIKREFLQSHALFGGIQNEQIELLIPLLKDEYHNKGDFIIREGANGDRLHFLVEGSVEVIKRISDHPGAPQRQLAQLGPGDTFGEMELIDAQPRSASVCALEDIHALTLSNMEMYQLYKSDIHLYTMIILNLAREISRRLRRMDAMIVHSVYTDLSPP